jgi:2-polyprenyl-3-methyl-5-hydroxy-6-metoxy-1,4-benzoquinol methylase
MDRTEISRIIHDVHEMMAPHYGHLDIHGQVAPRSLSHWNYSRNVKGPITRIIKDCLPRKSFSMLDAGCGNGQLFHLYASLGASRIFGADFGLRMLSEARLRAGINHLRFFPIRVRLEELAFADDSFDLVNLYGVIEHLPEPARVLRELARVMVPGGLLIFSVPRKGSLAWLTYAMFCPSLESAVMKKKLVERIGFRRKMELYRFYRSHEINGLIARLTGMTLIARIPAAHGGFVGFPSKLLRYFAARGRYEVLDRWNQLAKRMKLVPAGEYIVARKD